jgi:ABC-type phosphate/phosphonate transport system substrate-binding protein
MTSSRAELIVGAVAYDPKVVTIWDGFREWFRAHDLPLDYVLFTNYERQVEAHFAGVVDVAWNSPLAWIEARRLAERRDRSARALLMRDSDCDLTSLIVVRADAPIRDVAGLRGRRVGVGASDSPQATLLPLLHLAEAGLEPRVDFEVVPHDVLAGKHGDHIGGERDAARALLRGEVDAAALLDANHLAFAKDGTLDAGATRVIARTAAYDHCNFTVLDERKRTAVDRFQDLCLRMSYSDPAIRRLFDLEGLKTWKPGRTVGYGALERAVDRFHFLDSWLAAAASGPPH